MPKLFLPIATCLAALPLPAAAADTFFDYSLRVGHNSNLFEDANDLGGGFAQAEAKLRGSFDIEGSGITYALWHREKRLERYDFGNEHVTGMTLGHKMKLADTVEWTVEAGIQRKAAGDVFLAVPGTVIGYRMTDMTYEMASSLAAQFLGGQNTLKAGVSHLDRGKARFTTDLLLPTKLEADVTALDLTASHIRPGLDGEIGFTLAYRSTFIPDSEQETLLRFPASTLRGSVAYGRKIGETMTMIAEIGGATIMADDLGDDVKRLRPYLRSSLEWKPTESLGFGIGYDQDYAIADIDDPQAEFIQTWKFAASAKLLPKIEAKVTYEIASSEWIYYLYDSETRRFAGTLTFDIGKDHKLEIGYRHVDRREKDPAENYDGHEYFASMSGTF
ncbi:hypothetical protein QTA58_14875 [Neorhizobium sp. CSC1952]|uniref:Porin n=1 Tax=Xaviernesmea oryzae TaxID=464029 RepID=A0A1X7D1E1_9HYPH|nr:MULTISPECIES: hypothetical protein [Rhizobium/Agrobacterium group]WJR65517.1 hypothetical protein QTA58_14875 [Rhizobium sp. CSC1952]SMF06541.1 hypothetical protein SAMN02982989_4851 [Xaviernesmea oryzae]